jgi:hypothetical protein
MAVCVAVEGFVMLMRAVLKPLYTSFGYLSSAIDRKDTCVGWIGIVAIGEDQVEVSATFGPVNVA